MPKIFILLLLIGVLMLSSTSYSLTHKERFNQDYNQLVIKLKYSDFPGPLSKEMAKVALARQVLEDGPNRHPNESIAGISIGGKNKEIVYQTIPKHIKIQTINNSFYHFIGFQSNIYSAFIISRLFNYYINHFMKSERKNWWLSIETSKAIQQNPNSVELNHRFYNKLNPIRIIEKSDSYYGPEHQSVIQMYK